MPSRFTKGVRLALAGAFALGTSAIVLTAGTGVAEAAPCGNPGAGSGLFGSSGSSGSSTSPERGPQGPLPVYNGNISKVLSWVTGPRSNNDTYDRFGISGTDLGIAWDNGRGQTLMAFGDTFGNCSVAGQEWRHNVLLRTNDDDFTDGKITIPDGVAGDVNSGTVIRGRANYAEELIPSLGISNIEVTTIPTAAISLPHGNGFRQYINYMSVRSWGSAGNWITNYSGIAYSDNNGQTWTSDPDTILINAPIDLALPGNLRAIDVNNGKFQQNAYMRGRPGTDEEDYIYQFGTPNGRFGAAFLARFKPADILDLGKYQYWSGQNTGWVNSISDIHDTEGVVARQPVSELSVAWSPYLNKYIMLDGDNGIRLRTADHPEGPWSSPRNIVAPGNPVVYGPMMLPTSPALTGTGKELYFNASRWSDYNVMLIRSDLGKL
ncbi:MULTISPECIES: DUF4185 domain-containing protein [Gordonia]|uniref:DUF4185 domain-containing protein n=1 Tax=Gordonia TaxID=2053 RepID=UPI000960F3D5|nr:MULTISPECIES: DUF4185 domain-containing protein [Gordonia]MDH3009654.1 DUF4185 domain-containing protein [Gordonia alkanivorans]MDH3014097.1 DUF4185 domain-containing protein [Gordonia alkanivorans]MDH3051158.1 DUF4185 domain-containing protein [Gordonia alkanivorans]OLT51824.1 hypothetical protein BJF87_15480 [Gordonia sp. CNJ-863]